MVFRNVRILHCHGQKTSNCDVSNRLHMLPIGWNFRFRLPRNCGENKCYSLMTSLVYAPTHWSRFLRLLSSWRWPSVSVTDEVVMPWAAAWNWDVQPRGTSSLFSAQIHSAHAVTSVCLRCVDSRASSVMCHDKSRRLTINKGCNRNAQQSGDPMFDDKSVDSIRFQCSFSTVALIVAAM